MISQIAAQVFSLKLNEKSFLFICANESSFTEVKESLAQLLARIVEIEKSVELQMQEKQKNEESTPEIVQE